MAKGFWELGNTGKSSVYKKQEKTSKSKGKQGKTRDAERKKLHQALAFMEQKNYKSAEIIYKDLIKEGSSHHSIFGNLAVIRYYMENNIEEMIVFLRKALEVKPNYPEALNNLGTAVKEQGKLQEAIDCYRKALAIQPRYLEALNNLGTTLKEQGEFQEAIDCHRKALAIQPHYPEALNNLGTALKEEGELEEAIDCYRKALAIEPNRPEALNNLGVALSEQGKLQESIPIYRKVISLNEDYPMPHFNLSMCLLSFGDYENGWEEYEWRLREKGELHGQISLKKWDELNRPSENKLILMGEQGLGDILQFMRYIPLIRKKGINVALCTLAKLHSLIRASGIATELYSPEETHQLTTGEWLPLLSLPKHLKIRPNHVLVNKPYIKVPEEKISYWKKKLSSEKRPIIGINWQGNHKTERAVLRGRSAPLETFAPITETTCASFLSLQKGLGSEQLAECKFFGRFVGCQEEINQTWDFVENAAMVMNCDLVITVDTVVAHLAGGLGKRTWLLLHHIPDWRWGMEGDTTFWYPPMRLFRQREQGNWQEVIHLVAMALKTFPSNSPS